MMIRMVMYPVIIRVTMITVTFPVIMIEVLIPDSMIPSDRKGQPWSQRILIKTGYLASLITENRRIFPPHEFPKIPRRSLVIVPPN